MSRHRNFRNYSYEDDMSDDVYGHSVEDYDMAISPSTAAQFMYRRTNSRDASELGHYIGCVVKEEEDESEENDHPQNSQDYKRPQLDPISEAKLSSCLDQLHSILGETCHEPTAIQAVLKCNFDIEKALDDILNEGNKKDTKAAVKPSSSKVQSSVEEPSIKANDAMVSSSSGGNSPVTISQSRLLSMPLSTVLQSSDTISGEGSDHLPPRSSLLSSPPKSLSELSYGQSQFATSIASTASTQYKKEKHLFSKSLNPLKPALDNKSASHPLSSALSFSQTSNQQMSSDSQNSLSLLSGRCPSHVSQLGSPGSGTSLHETKLLSSSLNSLVQTISNTAVPSQGEQQSENKNRKLTELSHSPLGTVSLSDLASSHTSTSQHVPPLVAYVDAHKAQNVDAIQQGTCPSLATLAQEHSKNTEGRSSFNVLLQSAAVGGKENVSGLGKGEHQVSEVKALTLADLSLSSSKEVKISSSSGNVFSLSDLARAHGECNNNPLSFTSPSNLSQHEKHCNESLNLSVLSTLTTQVEITSKTNSSIFVNAKSGLDGTMSRSGLWDAAAEFHGETSNADETSHYENTSKAMQVSSDHTGLTLLTACLSSISVADQQIISDIGSKMINTGELTPQLQRPCKRAGSKQSVMAKPSMFALTISYTYRLPRNRKMKLLLTHSSFPPIDYGGNITSFNFSDPSPDDLVFEKQKKAFTKI